MKIVNIIRLQQLLILSTWSSKQACTFTEGLFKCGTDVPSMCICIMSENTKCRHLAGSSLMCVSTHTSDPADPPLSGMFELQRRKSTGLTRRSFSHSVRLHAGNRIGLMAKLQ